MAVEKKNKKPKQRRARRLFSDEFRAFGKEHAALSAIADNSFGPARTLAI